MNAKLMFYTTFVLAIAQVRIVQSLLIPSSSKIQTIPKTFGFHDNIQPNIIESRTSNVHSQHIPSRPFFKQHPRDPTRSSCTRSSSTRMKLSIQNSIPEIASTILQLVSTQAQRFRFPGPLQAIGINFILFAILHTKLLKVLTANGYVSAFVLGSGLCMSVLGWKAWTLCVLYLVLGSGVTKIKFQEKESLGIAEGRGGRRGPENVWGSALTGLICCCLATVTTSTKLSSLFTLAYVASISTKLSDTFASEIGKAYGKTTFLITTFQKVPAGTEGAVSLEGTLAALVGASILPLYASSIQLLTSKVSIGVATLSAFLATFAESWIGAQIQGKKGFEWMTNEVVNFFNTVIGAGLSILGMLLLGFH